jgi:hypothetical protein
MVCSNVEMKRDGAHALVLPGKSFFANKSALQATKKGLKAPSPCSRMRRCLAGIPALLAGSDIHRRGRQRIEHSNNEGLHKSPLFG